MNLLEQKIEAAVAIKNILYATDFSEVSEAALPYVTALSLRYGSTIHVAHVLPDVTFLRPGAPDPVVIGSIYEDAHSAAQERIQHVAEQLRGYAHHTYLRHGNVLDTIRELVEEQKIDLLVLGTHGRTGIGKLVMGSVAEQIFRDSKCPVLTVGPMAPSMARMLEGRHDREVPPAQIKFRRILYATDFQPDAMHSASYAASLAQEFQAELTLLHVIQDYANSLYERPGPIESTLRKLEQLVPDAEALRHRPQFLVEYGSPAELILKTARESEADLIVLGAKPVSGRMSVATRFVASVAHKVVAGAACPVLTVRG